MKLTKYYPAWDLKTSLGSVLYTEVIFDITSIAKDKNLKTTSELYNYIERHITLSIKKALTIIGNLEYIVSDYYFKNKKLQRKLQNI